MKKLESAVLSVRLSPNHKEHTKVTSVGKTAKTKNRAQWHFLLRTHTIGENIADIRISIFHVCKNAKRNYMKVF